MRKFLLFILSILFSISIFCTEEIAYTLTCPKSTTNTNYSTYYDVTISSITWRAPGNQYDNGDWRLGGKSISKVNRSIYSKTAIADDITKIVIAFGNNSGSITVHSAKFNVYSTAALAAALGTGDISSFTLTYAANTNDTVVVPPGKSWKGRYYSLILNVTVSGKNNKYAALSSIAFYKDDAVVTHTVTYNSNGGSGSMTDTGSPYINGSSVNTMDNTFTKNGYIFDSWNTESDGTGVEFYEGQSFSIDKDTTFYAQWLQNISGSSGDCSILSLDFDDCSRTGGNDGIWSGISGTTVDLDYTGWNFYKGSEAYQCGRFGTGSSYGSCTTPTLDATTNDLLLTFRAGAWNSSTEGITLYLEAENANLSESSVELTKGAFNTFKVKVTNITDDFWITWYSGGANCRFFLDDICLTELTEELDIVSWYKDSIILAIDQFDDKSFEVDNVRIEGLTRKVEPVTNRDNEYKVAVDLSESYCTSQSIIISDGTRALVYSVDIPYIITADANTSTISDEDCDVVVSSGSTLTAEGTTTVNRDVKVYGDAKLIVPSGTTYTMNSLALRRDNNKVPSAKIDGELSINHLYFDLYIDCRDWYFICLPDAFDLPGVKYANGQDTDDLLVAWYDGEYRASNEKNAWKDALGTELFPAGYGLIVGIDDTLVKKEFRIELDADIISAESSNKSVGNLHAWGGDKSKLAANHKGWNLVGNPYLCNLETSLSSPIRVDSLVKIINGDTWTGGWELSGSDRGKSCRYGVFPSKDPEDEIAGGYKSVVLDDIVLKPFTAFFVQIGGEDPSTNEAIVFNHSDRRNVAARYEVDAESEVESFLRIDAGKKIGIFISNKYTEEYEPGYDLESNYLTYQLINGYKLLYSAVNDSIIESGVLVKSPKCIIKVDPKTNLDEFEYIYTKVDNDWYDLTNNEVEFEGGEFLIVAKRKSKGVATGLGGIDANVITKYISGGGVFINKCGVIYDLLGRRLERVSNP